MAPKTISARILLAVLAVIILGEWIFAMAGPFGEVRGRWALLALRLAESLGILGVAFCLGKGLQTFGLDRVAASRGVFRGALWCLGFAAAALAGMGVLYAAGLPLRQLIGNPIPKGAWACGAYLLGAGLVGPVAEELFYRGVLFGFFRRWGVLAAIAASSVLFVLSHDLNRIPWTQAVGGVVFAVAYERERTLIAPLMIHMSGNLALAALGYWGG